MITINGKDFQLKYTIESWKKLKESCGVTPMNVEEKLNEDFTGVITDIIFFGLSPEDRLKIGKEEIELTSTFRIMDDIMPAIIESMPKAVKEASERKNQ